MRGIKAKGLSGPFALRSTLNRLTASGVMHVDVFPALVIASEHAGPTRFEGLRRGAACFSVAEVVGRPCHVAHNRYGAGQDL